MTITAQIETLIDKVDTFEVVRDQIAAILLVESVHQQALAAAGYQAVTVPDGGNIGNGTCTAVVAVGAPVIGTWALICSAAADDGGVFVLMNPSGGVAVSGLTITPGEATIFADQAGLTFTLTAGTVDFEIGDSFSLPIAHFDPRLWRLKVYLERANPWADFINAPDPLDVSPIINVAFDTTSYDQSRSNSVQRQRAIAIYHIDCYGYGVSSTEDPDEEGHLPGDEDAALEAHRAVRLVRNILMAGAHTYLGLQGLVAFRWPQSVTIFQPTADERRVQNVVGARIALEVHFNEFSPQVEGEPLELISTSVLRAETGQLLLRADYPKETSP